MQLNVNLFLSLTSFNVEEVDAWMFEAVVDASAAVPMLLQTLKCYVVLLWAS
jgi:hypothetical protein